MRKDATTTVAIAVPLTTALKELAQPFQWSVNKMVENICADFAATATREGGNRESVLAKKRDALLSIGGRGQEPTTKDTKDTKAAGQTFQLTQKGVQS